MLRLDDAAKEGFDTEGVATEGVTAGGDATGGVADDRSAAGGNTTGGGATEEVGGGTTSASTVSLCFEDFVTVFEPGDVILNALLFEGSTKCSERGIALIEIIRGRDVAFADVDTVVDAIHKRGRLRARPIDRCDVESVIKWWLSSLLDAVPRVGIQSSVQ